jgi:FkbM family methyltransferase
MPSLAQRIVDSIRNARDVAPFIGWRWVLQEKFLRRMNIREVRLHPSGLEHPVFCRVGSSDIFEYAHLLGRGRTSFGLSVKPAYIVDAGSNVGYSVLRFTSDYPAAKIVAIEPAKTNLSQIEKNCRHYANISVEEAALWSHKTKIRIKSLDVDDNAFQVEEDDSADIQALSIDDIMQRNNIPHIDILKVDIEGSETTVFEALDAQNWLRKVRVILVETHDRFKPGCTDAVENAVNGLFNFTGIIGEYRIYTSKALS